jgi:hypothetical protein
MDEINLKQKERQQRGENFEDEIHRGWLQVPNCWRLGIPGNASTRPADSLTLLPDYNILQECKRTAGDRFELSFLRKNQVTGLLNFEQTIPSRNLGVVFCSFLNEEKDIDETYLFRLRTGLEIMQRLKVNYITLEVFRGSHKMQGLRRVICEVDRVICPDGLDYWDIRRSIRWLQSL